MNMFEMTKKRLSELKLMTLTNSEKKSKRDKIRPRKKLRELMDKAFSRIKIDIITDF